MEFALLGVEITGRNFEASSESNSVKITPPCLALETSPGMILLKVLDFFRVESNSKFSQRQAY